MDLLVHRSLNLHPAELLHTIVDSARGMVHSALFQLDLRPFAEPEEFLHGYVESSQRFRNGTLPIYGRLDVVQKVHGDSAMVSTSDDNWTVSVKPGSGKVSVKHIQ